MNKQVIGAGAVLKLTTVLFAIGFCSIAQAAVVNLQVNDTQTKLTVTTPGNCTNGNSKGCVKGQGRQPINFNLTGNRSCSAGGSWELDYVALGMSEGSVGNLQAPVVPGDFNADPSSGRVMANSSSGNQIQVRNDNSAVYDVWYTVFATCGDSVIDTDPRIENDGSGRP